MSRLCQRLAFAVLLGFAASAGAGADEVSPGDTHEPDAADLASPHMSPAVWAILAVCLAVSLSAGGYTFFCYLRRRDTLSTLAALEERYRNSADFG